METFDAACCDSLGTRNEYPHEGFVDVAYDEAHTLAEIQLDEAIAAERRARRTVAQARAIMHDIKSSRGHHDPKEHMLKRA